MMTMMIDTKFELDSLYLIAYLQVLNVQIPFLFKLAVDRLSAMASDGAIASSTIVNSPIFALMMSPIAVLIGYGIARAGASACNGRVDLNIFWALRNKFPVFVIISGSNSK